MVVRCVFSQGKKALKCFKQLLSDRCPMTYPHLIILVLKVRPLFSILFPANQTNMPIVIIFAIYECYGAN